MQKHEQELLDFLLERSGLSGQDTSKKSHLAKLVLTADPDMKTITPESIEKYLAVQIPFANASEQSLYYLPVTKQSLTKKFSFAVKEILKKMELGNEMLLRINEDRGYSKNPATHLSRFEDGVKVPITLTQVGSLLTEAKNEIISATSLMEKCMKILSSKTGTKTYNLTQVNLTQVNQTFLDSILSEVEKVLKDKLSEKNLSQVNYFYAKRTRYLSRQEIAKYENPKVSEEFKYMKNTVASGNVMVYPVDYEKLANVVIGLVSKWVSKSEPSSESSKQERQNRQNFVSKESALNIIYSFTGTKDLDELVDAIKSRLLPSVISYSESNHPVLPITYLELERFFVDIGGDMRLIPSSYTHNMANPAAIREAIQAIKSSGLINQRLLFGMFKLLSDDSTLVNKDSSARKKLHYDFELSLINSVDKSGNPILMNINNKATDQKSAAIILSTNAYSQIYNSELKSKFASYHSSTEWGLVQKGAMSIGALIKMDKIVHTNNTVQQACDLISFVAEYYKWFSRDSLLKLKEQKDNVKKAENKELKKQERDQLGIKSRVNSPSKVSTTEIHRVAHHYEVTSPIQQQSEFVSPVVSPVYQQPQQFLSSSFAQSPVKVSNEQAPFETFTAERAPSNRSNLKSLGSLRETDELQSPTRQGIQSFGSRSNSRPSSPMASPVKSGSQELQGSEPDFEEM